MPNHYCPRCLSLTQADWFSCETCQEPIPSQGWPRTRPGRYGWLGEELEGRYHLVQFIGFGSTGEVYRATSRRFGRSFAAKIIDQRSLPRGSSTLELNERLRREIAILGQLDSPYVVPLVDVIQAQEDLMVLIMDLARGETLERIIFEQGWLAPPRAFEITEQILEALGDIHDHGIVHRDLKPANMIIKTLRSGRPFLRLLDFGTAKLRDEPAMTTGFVGTPLFSAPEQIRNALEVDARCDLYSAGCILFNMLTGTPPFGGETTIEVMQKHLTDPIPSIPSTLVAEPLNRPINEFLLRALAKEPGDRFASAAQMLSAPIFDWVKGALAQRRTRTQGSGSAPVTASGERMEAIGVGTLDYPITLDFTGQATPLVLALNSSGDLGATVTDQDQIVLHDLLSNQVLATERLPISGRPAHLFFTRDEQCLCVISESGGVAFYQPRPLSLITAHELVAGYVRWAGASARLNRGALLLGANEIILVEASRGELVRCPIDMEENEDVTLGGLAGDQGHRIFFNEAPHSLWIREDEDGPASIKFGFQQLPAPAKQAGRVMDVSPRGVYLLEKAGQFFEFEPAANEFRSLSEPTGQSWTRAYWLSEESRVAILSLTGNLYILKRGGRPELLHTSVIHLAVNADRSRIIFSDQAGRLMTWQPAQPAAQAIVLTVQQGDPSQFDQSWDIAPNRLLVHRVFQDGQSQIVYQQPAHDWAAISVEDSSPIDVVRWSADASALIAAPLSGCLHSFDLSRKRYLVLPAEVDGARCVAIANGGQSAYLVTGDGLLMAVSASTTREKARVYWRRPLDKEVSALAVSLVSERLVLGYRDGSLETFELSRGAHLMSLPNTHGLLLDFSFSADGHLFATLRVGGVVEVYDAHQCKLTYRETSKRSGLSRILLAEDGTLVAARRKQNQVEIIAVESGTIQEAIELATP